MTMQEFQLEIQHHLIQIELFLKQVKPGYKLALICLHPEGRDSDILLARIPLTEMRDCVDHWLAKEKQGTS